MHSQRKRSLFKALTYRGICTTETMAVSFCVIKLFHLSALEASTLIGGILLFTKIVTFYFHERLWDFFEWGRD